EFDEYEYCVKLIVACDKLRDKVESLSESDELNKDQYTVDAAIKKYKQSDCFPSGLSQNGLRLFMGLIARWESQVHELFLHQNLFSVVEENMGGQQLKVTFGKMDGWCPITTSLKESSKETSTLNPDLVITTKKNYVNVSVENTTDICKVFSNVSQWVHNEFNGIQNMSSFTNRFSDFEKLLADYKNQSCCSYKSIRDRVEIINDGIDILEDLQEVEPSEKKDYMDIQSDYRNLNRRLEHLRISNVLYSSGKCCPIFSKQFKSFKNNFQSNLNDFSPPQTNITLKDLLKNITTLEDTCSQHQNQLKSIQDLKNNRNKTENACCDEEVNKIKVIENSLKAIQAIKSPNLTDLRENLLKTNKTLSDMENMLDLEVNETEKLKDQCGKGSRIQASKTLIDGISSNVSKLVNKLNDMELIRTVDLSKLNTDSSQNLDTTFEGFNRTKRQNNIEKHKQDIANLNKTFQNVNLKYKNFQNYHELYQVAAKKIFEKYKKHQDDLNESIKAIEVSSQGSLSKDDETSKPDINKLEKDLVNLTDNVIPKLAQDIKDRRKDIADNFDKKEQQAITWFHEEMKRKKQQILERLDKLSQNKVDSEKIRQLEAHILQLSDRHAVLAKKIADRHEVLKQNLNEMQKRIAAASSNALSCQQDCSLDNFPTMDDLAKRVKVLEQQLKN
ncbi:hypothetical protein KR054_006341, partial [Drosophila jambulina]